MDSSGDIHRFKDLVEKEAKEKEVGKLIELEEETAKKLEALPKEIRQAFYKAIEEKPTRDGSFTKPKFDKAKVRKKNKLARAARKRSHK